MPTGYTCYIEDGKGCTFEEFVWICARAFGALVMMREEGMDAKIDLEPKPDLDYHERALNDAKIELAKAKSMTLAKAKDQAIANYERAVRQEAESKLKAAEKVLRYKEMLAQVQAWTPPTKDHEGLKKFMIQQIEDSMKYAAHTDREPKIESAVEYKNRLLESAQRDIDYHEKEIRQEIKRAKERGEWLQGLNKSVPIPKAKKK